MAPKLNDHERELLRACERLAAAAAGRGMHVRVRIGEARYHWPAGGLVRFRCYNAEAFRARDGNASEELLYTSRSEATALDALYALQTILERASAGHASLSEERAHHAGAG